MNKAFIREADSADERCPRCHAPGQPVGAATLDALLLPERRRELGETAYFCVTPQCEVAYFDPFERVVTTAALRQPVYPKDPDAPLCPCFGVTADEIEQDARRGEVGRVRGLLDRAKSAEAACITRSVRGQSCATEVQRCFLRAYHPT